MEDICDEFVRQLHGFIQNDMRSGFNEKKLNALFSRAIDSLPNEELSKHIDENYVVYYKKFCRLFEHELSTIDIDNDLLEFPFVNYSKNVEELCSLQDSDRSNAFTGMLLQAEEKDVNRLFEKAKEMLTERNFFTLCMRLLIVKPSNIPLLRLALQATSCLSEKFEQLSSDISSAEDYKLLMKDIKLCCSLIANNYKTAVNDGRYSHTDIMAALLSIYTDAFLQLTSAKSAEIDHKNVAKDLITYINTLLQEKSSLYDIFLQVYSNIGIDLKKVLVFATKMALEKNRPLKDDCLSYIKFLLLCKQAVDLSQECQCNDEEKYFKVNALKTQPPMGLTDWLLGFSSMDGVTLTKSNKLWELIVDSDEMSGKLLEVIEAEAEKLSLQKVETNKETEKEELTNTVPEPLDTNDNDDSGAGLFFFDTKPSKKKAYQPDKESEITKGHETPIHVDSENEEEKESDDDGSVKKSVNAEKEDGQESDCFVRLRNLSESDINSYSSANEGIQDEVSKERFLRKRRKINKEMDNDATTDDCLSPKKNPGTNDKSKKRKTSTRKGKTARRLSKIQELTDSDTECSDKKTQDNKMASNSSPSKATLPERENSEVSVPSTPRRSRRLLNNT